MTDTKHALESLFYNAEKFYLDIDKLVWDNDITYMEALMQVCDEKGIDPEDLPRLKLISPLLKMKLYDEAVEAGQIKENTYSIL